MLGKEITIGGYLPGDSILHRLDVRTKLLCFLTLLLAVSFLITSSYAHCADLVVRSRNGRQWAGLARLDKRPFQV